MPYANVNGIKIYYETYGEGYPVVLIGGLGSQIPSWATQIPIYSKHFQVIVFDNRGIGRSISKATGVTPNLQSYVVAAITGGTDAQGEVTVRVEEEGIVSQGQGANTDVVVASAKAFVNALNKLRWRKEHPRRATSTGF